jgi:ribokinase
VSGNVVVIGSINLDVIAAVARLPRPGETALAQRVDVVPGGKGANQALGAARAGARVTLISAVGEDGEQYLRYLEKHGVSVQHVMRAPLATGRAYIAVDDQGENSIIVAAGANAALTAHWILRCQDVIRSADIVLVQQEIPTAAIREALTLAADAQVPTILNASPVDAASRELGDLATVVVVNEHENRVVGIPDAVVTLGAAGARWGDDAVRPMTATTVDTTGAGDAFAGALAAALAVGRSRSQALAMAVESGTSATQWAGAQPDGFEPVADLRNLG